MNLQRFIRLALIGFVIALVALVFYMMDRPPEIAEGIDKVHVVDDTGTEMDLPLNPKRVVLLNVSNLDIFVTVGGKNQIVGRPTSKSYTDDLLAEIAPITEVGTVNAPNIEQILALKPDLVIGVNMPFHTLLRMPLSANGIPLYINTIDSYDDTMNTLELFGKLTGQTALAQKRASEIGTAVTKAASVATGKPAQKALIMFGSPDSMNMSTSKSFSGEILNILGGTNIADVDSNLKDTYVPLSLEYVIQHDPDIIFIIAMGVSSEVMQRFRDELRTKESWRDVKAVKNDNVHLLPSNLFTINPGSRLVDAVNYMAGKLYPEEAK